MSWLLLAFLIPPLLFVVMARRAIRVARLLRDPERLHELLSAETRMALLRADIDPNTVDFETLRGSEELTRAVARDLRQALSREVLGLGVVSRLPRRRDGLRAPGLGTGLAHPRPGAGVGDRPSLPAPIDAESGVSPAFVLALVVVALGAAAVVLLHG